MVQEGGVEKGARTAFIPRMIHLSLKGLYAGYVGIVGLGQQTQGGDQVSSRKGIAGRTFHDPDVLGLVIVCVL